MEDPFGSLNAYCRYTSSQEDLLKNSLLAREAKSPEPYPPPPSSASEGNGIVICSAPETPVSDAVASPSVDEFKTPPEESRRSSSEEAPPLPQKLGEFDGPGAVDGGHGTPVVETDSGVSDGGTLDLGFSQEGAPSPKMVEILSDGKVRVGEVSKLDLESFRVGERRGPQKRSPLQEPPSPSKRIRVSVDSSVLVNTPNLAMGEEGGEGLEKREMESPIDIVVNVNMDVETEVCDGLDSGTVEVNQMIDTEVNEDCDDGEEDCAKHGGISTVQQEQEEEEEEEGMENGNGNRETGVDNAGRQGRRELPPSWVCRNGGNREDGNRSNTGRASSGNGMGVVMEVLRWLAKEERQNRPDQGPVDFIETAKRHGMTFTEPKWWHDNENRL